MQFVVVSGCLFVIVPAAVLPLGRRAREMDCHYGQVVVSLGRLVSRLAVVVAAAAAVWCIRSERRG